MTRRRRPQSGRYPWRVTGRAIETWLTLAFTGPRLCRRPPPQVRSQTVRNPPRSPKIALRAPKIAPRSPMSPPRSAQDRHQSPQGRSKRLQDAPKIALRGPKIDPRRSKIASRSVSTSKTLTCTKSYKNQYKINKNASRATLPLPSTPAQSHLKFGPKPFITHQEAPRLP